MAARFPDDSNTAPSGEEQGESVSGGDLTLDEKEWEARQIAKFNKHQMERAMRPGRRPQRWGTLGLYGGFFFHDWKLRHVSTMDQAVLRTLVESFGSANDDPNASDIERHANNETRFLTRVEQEMGRQGFQHVSVEWIRPGTTHHGTFDLDMYAGLQLYRRPSYFRPRMVPLSTRILYSDAVGEFPRAFCLVMTWDGSLNSLRMNLELPVATRFIRICLPGPDQGNDLVLETNGDGTRVLTWAEARLKYETRQARKTAEKPQTTDSDSSPGAIQHRELDAARAFDEQIIEAARREDRHADPVSCYIEPVTVKVTIPQDRVLMERAAGRERVYAVERKNEWERVLRRGESTSSSDPSDEEGMTFDGKRQMKLASPKPGTSTGAVDSPMLAPETAGLGEASTLELSDLDDSVNEGKLALLQKGDETPKVVRHTAREEDRGTALKRRLDSSGGSDEAKTSPGKGKGKGKGKHSKPDAKRRRDDEEDPKGPAAGTKL